MRVSNMIQAVDTHVCGEPGRVIVGGVLDVPGSTMFEKMTYLETEADELRVPIAFTGGAGPQTLDVCCRRRAIPAPTSCGGDASEPRLRWVVSRVES